MVQFNLINQTETEHLLHKMYIHTVRGSRCGVKMSSENLQSGRESRQNTTNGSKMELCVLQVKSKQV